MPDDSGWFRMILDDSGWFWMIPDDSGWFRMIAQEDIFMFRKLFGIIVEFPINPLAKKVVMTGNDE